MSVKEFLNRNPLVTVAVVVLVAGAALWFGVSGAMPRTEGTRVYFTDDDGKTWFADNMRTVTPYTRGGKEVVRAYVYQCSDGKQFVAYLTRQNPNAPQEQPGTGAPTKPTSVAAAASRANSAAMIDFKKPGESTWLNGRFGDKSIMFKYLAACPGGGYPEPVAP